MATWTEISRLGLDGLTAEPVTLNGKTFKGGSFAQFMDFLTAAGVSTGPEVLELMEQQAAFTHRFRAIYADPSGVPKMSVDQVVEYENITSGKMRALGLPETFYNDVDDFARLIHNDVSINEIDARVNEAAVFVGDDPDLIDTAFREFGLTRGDLISFALDADVAIPAIQAQANAIQIATAGFRQGVTVDSEFARNLDARDITAEQANEAFRRTTIQGGLEDENLTQETIAEANFGVASAQQQVQQQIDRNEARAADAGNLTRDAEGFEAFRSS